MHVCLGFLREECDYEECPRSHNILDEQPRNILTRFGFNPNTDEDELLVELMNAPQFCKSYFDQFLMSSNDENEVEEISRKRIIIENALEAEIQQEQELQQTAHSAKYTSRRNRSKFPIVEFLPASNYVSLL